MADTAFETGYEGKWRSLDARPVAALRFVRFEVVRSKRQIRLVFACAISGNIGVTKKKLSMITQSPAPLDKMVFRKTNAQTGRNLAVHQPIAPCATCLMGASS